MEITDINWQVFDAFHFSYPPTGIKFLMQPPSGLDQMQKSMALCEMVRESQNNHSSFFITVENEDCSGKFVLGMATPPPSAAGGQVGIRFGIFNDARANSRLLSGAPSIPAGTVNCVTFAPYDNLSFDPDLLIIVATPVQAEIILRSMSYSTGERWNSQVSMVGACAWLFVYPYQSGKVNYIPTGITFGMKARKVYPEGFIVLSIPYNWIPVIVKNMQQMEWDLPAYKGTRNDFIRLHDAVMTEIHGE